MVYELRSLERALEVLGHLSTVDSATLTEVSDRLGLNQTTCLRTMRVLERHGYVRRDDRTRAYALGMRLVELGALAVSQVDIVGSLRPYVTPLAREFNVAAHIGLLRDGMVTVIDKVDPLDGMVRYSLLGTRMPLHCTGMGKALLALHGPDNMSAAGLQPPLTAYTRHTITDMQSLHAEIAATAARGSSREIEEWQPGFNCVGTSFRFTTQEIAVSLSGPLTSTDELDRRAARLRSAIQEFVDSHGPAIQRQL